MQIKTSEGHNERREEKNSKNLELQYYYYEATLAKSPQEITDQDLLNRKRKTNARRPTRLPNRKPTREGVSWISLQVLISSILLEQSLAKKNNGKNSFDSWLKTALQCFTKLPPIVVLSWRHRFCCNEVLLKKKKEEEEKKAFKNSFNTCQSKLYSINLHDEPWSDPCSSPGSVDNYTARMSCERKRKNKQKERKKASKQASFRNSFDDTWLRRYNSVSQNLHLEPSYLPPSLHCFFLFVSLCVCLYEMSWLKIISLDRHSCSIRYHPESELQ